MISRENAAVVSRFSELAASIFEKKFPTPYGVSDVVVRD